MGPTSYKSQWYLYCIVIALIVMGTAFGCVLLGEKIANDGQNIAVQAVYDHGHAVGFAQGINQSETTCARQIIELKADCNQSVVK